MNEGRNERTNERINERSGRKRAGSSGTTVPASVTNQCRVVGHCACVHDAAACACACACVLVRVWMHKCTHRQNLHNIAPMSLAYYNKWLKRHASPSTPVLDAARERSTDGGGGGGTSTSTTTTTTTSSGGGDEPTLAPGVVVVEVSGWLASCLLA